MFVEVTRSFTVGHRHTVSRTPPNERTVRRRIRYVRKNKNTNDDCPYGLRYQRKNEAGNFREFYLTLNKNALCTFDFKILSTQSFNVKFGKQNWKKIVQVCKRHSEFSHPLAKETRGRTADLCRLCFHCVHCAQRKKGQKNSRHSFFLFAGIYTNMLLIVFLALIAKLTSVSGDCDVGNLTQNNFDWDNVGIVALT